MRQPGIEPGSTAWKATMLTVTPPTLTCKRQKQCIKLYNFSQVGAHPISSVADAFFPFTLSPKSYPVALPFIISLL